MHVCASADAQVYELLKPKYPSLPPVTHLEMLTDFEIIWVILFANGLWLENPLPGGSTAVIGMTRRLGWRRLLARRSLIVPGKCEIKINSRSGQVGFENCRTRRAKIITLIPIPKLYVFFYFTKACTHCIL